MRNAAFLAVGLLLIVVQSNLYRLLGPLDGILGSVGLSATTPSLVLPLIIFLGVHEHSMARGALLAFAYGYLTDLFASAPIGLFAFVSVAIWWLSRMAGVRLTAQTALTRMSLAFGFALVESGIVLILLAIFGSDTRRPLEIGATVLPHAIVTALVSPVIFRIAQRLQQGSVVRATEAAPS
jgi:rod shape-determining protein MreD